MYIVEKSIPYLNCRFLLQFDIYLFQNQNVNDFPTKNIRGTNVTPGNV